MLTYSKRLIFLIIGAMTAILLLTFGAEASQLERKNNDKIVIENDLQFVKIEGKFNNVREADYEVYIKTDLTWVLLKSVKSTSRFSYSLDINQNYMFKFIKDYTIKYMFIETKMSATIMCDIDFDNNNSASIYPDKREKYYVMELLDDDEEY